MLHSGRFSNTTIYLYNSTDLLTYIYVIVLDRVFDEATITLDVFEDTCRPIVESALAGFNGNCLHCIFDFGSLNLIKFSHYN